MSSLLPSSCRLDLLRELQLHPFVARHVESHVVRRGWALELMVVEGLESVGGESGVEVEVGHVVGLLGDGVVVEVVVVLLTLLLMFIDVCPRWTAGSRKEVFSAC